MKSSPLRLQTKFLNRLQQASQSNESPSDQTTPNLIESIKDKLRSKKFIKAVKTLQTIQRVETLTKKITLRAKTALLKEQNLRTESDIDAIKHFMLKLQFVRKFLVENGEYLVREFCKNLYYKCYNENEEIIHINREGTTFYVILSGTVSVQIYKPKLRSLKNGTLAPIPVKEPDNVDYDDVNKYERAVVRNLGPGDSFGELSLMDFRNRTTATILTRTFCEVGCIDRQSYWDIIGRIKRNEIEEKLTFIHSIPIFQKWTDQDIKTLSYHFEWLQCSRDLIVVSEGTECDAVFFVKSGQFTVRKHYIVDNQDFQAQFFRKVNKSQEIEISLMVKGEMFGQDMLLGHPKNQFTIKCTHENSQLYRIPYSDLKKRLWDKESKDSFFTGAESQLRWRLERFQKLCELKQKLNGGSSEDQRTAEFLNQSVNRIYQLKIGQEKQLQSRSRQVLFRPNPEQTIEIADNLKGAQRSATSKSRETTSHSPMSRSNRSGFNIVIQMALKRGQIQRFKRSPQTEMSQDVIPKISLHEENPIIDFMDAEASFENIERIRSVSQNKFNILRDSSPRNNPVRLNQFLKFAAGYGSSEISKAASSFYHLVWQKKTPEVFQQNLKVFLKEAQVLTEKTFFELLKFYLEATIDAIPSSDRHRYAYISQQATYVEQVFEAVLKRQNKVIHDLILKIKQITTLEQ